MPLVHSSDSRLPVARPLGLRGRAPRVLRGRVIDVGKDRTTAWAWRALVVGAVIWFAIAGVVR